MNSFKSTKPAEIAPFVGKHYIYTYENGWQYELYVKNDRTIDYRIHSGLVAGRWVKGQEAHIVRLSDDVFKISWHEPTGTNVSVTVNLAERRTHGATFFPQWIERDPQKIVGYQNEHIDLMRQYRMPARPILSCWWTSSRPSRSSKTAGATTSRLSPAHPASCHRLRPTAQLGQRERSHRCSPHHN